MASSASNMASSASNMTLSASNMTSSVAAGRSFWKAKKAVEAIRPGYTMGDEVSMAGIWDPWWETGIICGWNYLRIAPYIAPKNKLTANEPLGRHKLKPNTRRSRP